VDWLEVVAKPSYQSGLYLEEDLKYGMSRYDDVVLCVVVEEVYGSLR